jgi:plastocyanin
MTPTRLLPILAISLALIPAASASAGDTKVIKVKDTCDPATFNAALGPGACVPIKGDGGSTEFEELLEQVADDGKAEYYKFSPRKTKVDAGERVVAEFRKGGEAHTFTEVDVFGAGCVDELNVLMGLTGAPVADCGLIESTYIGPQRREIVFDSLSTGTHRFMCLIHPWMSSTITVRER